MSPLSTVSEPDDLIAILGQRVLDGEVVDWNSAEAEAGDRRLALESLKALQAVARVHWNEHSGLGSHPPLPTDDAAVPSRWGHLDILEPIGRGASGQVFRAWDTRLDREVALKLLPAGSVHESSSPVIREGRLLARVRHPNVVTIYGAERIGDRAGLWMEYVRGRTLEEILSKRKTFTQDETIAIGAALCQAVAAVHAAGLLHRDIKAHNVMQAADGRTVLMDFGTGQELDDQSAPSSAGTPLYLAPELFRGAPPTVCSDIYSLGVLLFRMLTGTYPVRAQSVADLRRAHEAGERVHVRDIEPAVSSGLARAIERAVDPVAERRWTSAEAFANSLVKLRRGSRIGPILLSLGGVAILAAAGYMVSVSRRPPDPAPPTAALASPPAVPASGSNPAAAPASTVSPPPIPEPVGDAAAPAPPPRVTVPAPEPSAALTPDATGVARADHLRPSIQVVPFTNASGRASDAWLSVTLAELMLREFRATEAFRWIPGAVPLAKAQLGQALITESSASVRPVIPADVAISGEYVLREEPNHLRIIVRLQHEASGKPPTILIETGTTTDLVGLVSRISSRARAALGDKSPSRYQQSAPATAEAARWYADGLTKGTPAEGAEMMERAIAADPRFAPAHIRLAETMIFLRNPEKARSSAALAVELAASLPREERTLIEIRARVVSANPNRNQLNGEAFEQLFEWFPDTLLYGFESARYQSLTDAARALTTIGKVSKVPGASDDHGLLRLEGTAAMMVRDFPRAERAYAAAEGVARTIGDRVLLGYVLNQQAEVALERGDPVRQLSLSEDALRSFMAARNYAATNHGRAMVHRVYELHGGFAWARKTYDELIASARVRGDRAAEAHLRVELFTLLADHGNFADAQSVLDQIGRESTPEDVPALTDTPLRVGFSKYRQGEFAAAIATLEGGLPQLRKYADQYGDLERWAVYRMAQIALDRGDLEAAAELADRGSQSARAVSLNRSLAMGLAIKARTLLARGEADAANEALGEASKSVYPGRQTIQPAAFDVRLVSALVALDQKRYGEARSFATQAGELARLDLQPDREADAATVTALAWLAEGRIAEASRAIEPVAERVKTTEDRLLRLSGGIALARVTAASRTPADLASAKEQLSALLHDAAQLSAVPLELEARLALAEVEVHAGDPAGRTRLANLERDATAKGFIQIARKVSEVGSPRSAVSRPPSAVRF